MKEYNKRILFHFYCAAACPFLLSEVEIQYYGNYKDGIISALVLCYSLFLILRCTSGIWQKKKKNGSCFFIHSVSLCLFTGELRPLMLREINVFVDICYFVVVVCVCFPSFGLPGWDYSLHFLGHG